MRELMWGGNWYARPKIYSRAKTRHKRAISRFGTVHARLERPNAGPSRPRARAEKTYSVTCSPYKCKWTHLTSVGSFSGPRYLFYVRLLGQAMFPFLLEFADRLGWFVLYGRLWIRFSNNASQSTKRVSAAAGLQPFRI